MLNESSGGFPGEVAAHGGRLRRAEDTDPLLRRVGWIRTGRNHGTIAGSRGPYPLCGQARQENTRQRALTCSLNVLANFPRNMWIPRQQIQELPSDRRRTQWKTLEQPWDRTPYPRRSDGSS